mgnify:FL=1
MVQKATSAAMQRLLHKRWNPALAYNLQISAPEMSLFDWKTERPEGEAWEETQQTEGNAYLAARDEDEYLPGYDPSSNAEDAI